VGAVIVDAEVQAQRRGTGRRRDRRSRYRNDPSLQISVSLTAVLKQQLDDAVIAQRSTISGIMRQALVEWLERHPDTTGAARDDRRRGALRRPTDDSVA
jgi:hypothetical protein